MSDQAADETARTFRWVAEPETPDWSVRQATGRGWEEWVALIDAGPGRSAGHPAIAAWVHEFDPELSGWWAQGVTVGYERITGLRMPGQMPDGTFTVSRSRVLARSAESFRAELLDEEQRAELLPGFTTVLRSKPASKSLRFSLAEAEAAAAEAEGEGEAGSALGILMVTIDPAPGERIRVTVTHEKLPDFAATEGWKRRWADWLAGLPEN